MGQGVTTGRNVVVAVLGPAVLVIALGVFWFGVSDPASSLDRQFEAALGQGDLDAAWALLGARDHPTAIAPGRAGVFKREHFDAAFRHAEPTGRRSGGGVPVYRWPNGEEQSMFLSAHSGAVLLSPSASFHIVVFTDDAPVATRVDGVEIRGSYNDQSWALGWLLDVSYWAGHAPLHVEVEFADGHRLAVTTMPRPRFVQVMRDPDRVFATTGVMTYPDACVGLGCPLISNRRLDDSRLQE